VTKRRILVVDDDPSIRRSLNIALTKAGYEVFEAQDGEEATRLWHDNGAELVIADIYMPRKSGLEIIAELRAHSPSTPVIAMTDGGRTKNLNPLSYAEQLGAARDYRQAIQLG
jgi:DNA-binding response OmpR family regulator